VFAEPTSDYFSRKCLPLAFVFVALAALSAVDVALGRGADWWILLVANVVIIGGSGLLLFEYRSIWRFQRFRIFEDGFSLPGSRAGPDGTRFVSFEQIHSVEAHVLPVKESVVLVGVAVRLKPETSDEQTVASRPREILISSSVLGRRSILRLWEEWVKRGLADEESLRRLSSIRHTME